MCEGRTTTYEVIALDLFHDPLDDLGDVSSDVSSLASIKGLRNISKSSSFGRAQGSVGGSRRKSGADDGRGECKSKAREDGRELHGRVIACDILRNVFVVETTKRGQSLYFTERTGFRVYLCRETPFCFIIHVSLTLLAVHIAHDTAQ